MERTRLRAYMAIRVGCLLMAQIVAIHAMAAPPPAVVCPENKPEIPELSRGEVYSGVPFKPGERAEYEVRYFGALAGYGSLEVLNPVKHNGAWHRSYQAEAKTGDWYKLIFVAHDKLSAISRPFDFAIAKFYMEQDEGKLFSKRFRQKKWLDFDHNNCVVREKIAVPDKKEKYVDVPLEYGAIDALGAVYKLRTYDYKLKQTERALIYTSEKNWWLEATPIAFEKVKVPAGTFEAVKLRLQTFIGKELQQRGDLYVWIDIKSPSRTMLQIEGEVKIGSVNMKLVEFKPGQG